MVVTYIPIETSFDEAEAILRAARCDVGPRPSAGHKTLAYDGGDCVEDSAARQRPGGSTNTATMRMFRNPNHYGIQIDRIESR
jgi:hypothetical protein